MKKSQARIASAWERKNYDQVGPIHCGAGSMPLPLRIYQERVLALAQAIEPGSFSSLHDDLVAGRPMELEGLHGFVVRRAAQHGLTVPMSEAVYAILQPWAVRNQRANT